MRTPLNNLMLRNQHALHRRRTVDEYEDLLVMQQDEYERLARLIESMLFLGRAEKRQCAPVCLPMSLSSLFVQLADYFEGVARERSMVLNVDGWGELCADQALVRRAVANLLVNAICYGQPGTAIEWRSVARLGAVDIEVFNRGEMIAARDLPQLFDRFFRCDPARANSDGSGGLGLAIVQSIMQMHGGEVLVSGRNPFYLAFSAGGCLLSQRRIHGDLGVQHFGHWAARFCLGGSVLERLIGGIRYGGHDLEVNGGDGKAIIILVQRHFG